MDSSFMVNIFESSSNRRWILMHGNCSRIEEDHERRVKINFFLSIQQGIPSGKVSIKHLLLWARIQIVLSSNLQPYFDWSIQKVLMQKEKKPVNFFSHTYSLFWNDFWDHSFSRWSADYSEHNSFVDSFFISWNFLAFSFLR